MSTRLNFEIDPGQYRHWQISVDGDVAHLVLDVDEQGGVFDGYELKLNSYDIGVDIELADAVQRLRFEHPQVRAVLLESGKPGTFCAGANIRMLGGASHAHKVNFCKFTNETRSSIEDASRNSGQTYIAAIAGTAAGGGYELALAADKILLIDDGQAAVSLPEVPLLAVLPGTGGLTRLVDKRKIRRDIADVFCTLEEGMQGEKAVQARLVDEAIPSSRFASRVAEVLTASAASAPRTNVGQGVALTPLAKELDENELRYSLVRVVIERDQGCAHVTLLGPDQQVPLSIDAAVAQGAEFWPLQLMRELDDALLELRFNELEIGTLFIHSQGSLDNTASYDALLQQGSEHWFACEVQYYIQRVLKRLDLTSRSLFTLVEPGSCFAGFLAEVLFAADRSYMLEGTFEDGSDDRDKEAPANILLSSSNFGQYQMVNDLSRLAVRFLGEPESLTAAQGLIGRALPSEDAALAGLITVALDDIDWEDELRLLREERAGFSPDALTAMEANLRFAGPETMESKIFARLTAWQNWIFQRPNAVGEEGALKLYGTGRRPDFDKTRV